VVVANNVQFTSNSAAAKKALGDVGKAWVRDTTFDLQRQSLQRTPVDIGQLRTSQKVEFDKQAGGRDAQGRFTGGQEVGIVGYTAEYAPYVHEIPDAELSAETRAIRQSAGTSSNFLRGAMEDNKGRYQADLENRLRGLDAPDGSAD
jgi:hypothetical protein